MNFGILVFPDVEELDFVGPWEMAGMWHRWAEGPEHRFIVAESPAPVTCAKACARPWTSFSCPAARERGGRSTTRR